MKTKTFYMLSETPMDDPRSIPESRLEDFGDTGMIAAVNARNADHARKKLRQGEGISLSGAKLTCQEAKGNKCYRYATTKDAKCVSEPPPSPLKRKRKPKPPEEAVSWCSDWEVIQESRRDREGEEYIHERQYCLEYTPNCLNPGGVTREKAIKPKRAKLIKEKKAKIEKITPALIPVKEKLSSDEMKVLELIGPEKWHIDDIAKGTGLKSYEISSALLMLELKGLIHQSAGKNFQAKAPEPVTIKEEIIPVVEEKPAVLIPLKYHVGQDVEEFSTKTQGLVRGKISSVFYDKYARGGIGSILYKIQILDPYAKTGYPINLHEEKVKPIGTIIKQPKPFIDDELAESFKFAIGAKDIETFERFNTTKSLNKLKAILPEHAIADVKEFFESVKSGKLKPPDIPIEPNHPVAGLGGFPMLSAANLLRWVILNPLI